jgi:hypothetical protein
MKSASILLFLIIVFNSSCRIRKEKFDIEKHKKEIDCRIIQYISQFNTSITYPKIIILRTNFCGSELCGNELKLSLLNYEKNNHDTTLLILDKRDTTIAHIFSHSKYVNVNIDEYAGYMKYGYQRPGHYTFIKTEKCYQSYINVNRSFFHWFSQL